LLSKQLELGLTGRQPDRLMSESSPDDLFQLALERPPFD
jgi:hypothetical protein